MKRRNSSPAGLLLFLLLNAVIWWTGTGNAFEPFRAKTVMNLNLRKSPGLEGGIMSTIRKGQTVLVRNRQKDWFQVVVDGETYGLRGWMHGKFLVRIPAEKATKKPGQMSPLEEMGLGLEPGKKEEVLLEGQPAQNLLGQKVGSVGKRLDADKRPAASRKAPPSVKKVADGPPRITVSKIEKEIKPASSKQTPAVKEEADIPPMIVPAVERGAKTVPLEPTSALKKAVDDPAGMMVSKLEKEAKPASSKQTPAVKDEADIPPTKTAIRDRRGFARGDMPGDEWTLTRAPNASHFREEQAENQGLSLLLRLAVRLFTVLLSCLAILFSYRAMKLARISHKATEQFQSDLLIRKQRNPG